MSKFNEIMEEYKDIISEMPIQPQQMDAAALETLKNMDGPTMKLAIDAYVNDANNTLTPEEGEGILNALVNNQIIPTNTLAPDSLVTPDGNEETTNQNGGEENTLNSGLKNSLKNPVTKQSDNRVQYQNKF